MKKTKIFVIAVAIIVCFAAILSSCAGNKDNISQSGEGGSDITNETTVSTTAPPPKYSPDDKLIALTFDDGPSKSSTNRILDILEKNNSAATFFVVGYNIDKNAETIKRASNLGCEIANHSDSHKNLMKCDVEAIRSQVNNPNNKLKSITGVSPVLFRAPGGNFTGVEDEIGMPLIQWSIDTEDWKFKDASHKNRTEEQRKADLKRIADKVVADAEKGDIVLMHDIYSFTADLCEQLIPALNEKGFKLVTVSEMYEAYGVELENGKVYYNIDVVAANSTPLAPGNYVVATNGGLLNVREKADAYSASLAKIPNHTPVIVLRSVPGWAYVEYDGVSGWINASFLAKEQA